MTNKIITQQQIIRQLLPVLICKMYKAQLICALRRYAHKQNAGNLAEMNFCHKRYLACLGLRLPSTNGQITLPGGVTRHLKNGFARPIIIVPDFPPGFFLNYKEFCNA